ncbi:MAG: glycosyltransferase family 9 protein [Planctomycetales bacterium]|nr:glycosyltransferase family 9 protein [Planctomycetales bacterium]
MNLAAPATQRPGPRPRILIVRLSALGDVVHGLPVACALRDAFPDATIGWAVEGRNVDLLAGHPAIDHLIGVQRRWLKSARAVLDLRRRLLALRFDIAVDLQCLTKSAVVAYLSGAKRRLGVAGSDGRELSKMLNNELTPVQADHVVDHYLGILRPLGITNPAVRFDLPENRDDGAFAERMIRAGGLSPRGFAVLNPGAGWPSKLWPAERYGQLAQQLWAEHDLPSLAVWGPASERTLAEEIVAHSGGAARLAPATSVGQLAAVTRRARLFVGSDTGPMHLAVAVDTPTVSLHGPSRSAWCGAYGAANARVQAHYQDGTARQRRQADNSAMRAIAVKAVASACRDVLARTASRATA